ncbi:MAG: ABC transporter permease [Armatimonadota bacterium]|nr:ABC transporter permease [Armatimonadota bacterium]
MAPGPGRWPLGRYVGVLAALVLLNFFLPRLLPGSPLAAGGAEGAPFLPARAAAELRRTYGLDRPMAQQLVQYLAGLARGDLGRSLTSHRPVTALIAERLPWTVFLVGLAVLVAAALGAALGTMAAWSPQRPLVRLATPLVVGLGTLPEFLVAMGLIVVLGTGWQLFPVGGAVTPFLPHQGPGGLAAWVADVVRHAALPGATLVAALVPAFFLLSRNALAATLGAPYLLVARGKGLDERGVLWHAWRNALPSVAALLGLRLGYAVTGAAVVERIFAYPGMGLLLVDAVAQRDYPVMQGVFLTASVAALATVATLDALAAMLDPRLRRGGAR